MVGFALSTLLCIGRPCSPTVLCLFLRGPETEKWLRAVGLRSPCWRSSSEHPIARPVGFGSGLLVLGMGAPSDALEHKFWASGREWVGVVVRAALADSVFG